jgi:ubiquinone/menaquinone biosynthesis C-methylase UbiE
MQHSPGSVIHWAARYDLLLTVITLGRERRFRERLLALARVAPGEAVLDIGCGTGSLAIAAKRAARASAAVHGIDAAPEMIARARRKAAKAGVDVAFETALAQSLPFPDGQFDVVLSTVMLHHLPRAARPKAIGEARRVLKPGGRLLVVDFGGSGGHGLLAHLHRHGAGTGGILVALATDVGLRVVESGPAGMWDLQFVLAARS